MSRQEELEKFYFELNQEVINKAAMDDDEDFRENVFTQVVIDYLCESGQIEDGNVAYNENKVRGIKVNGFSIDEDETSLTLFVCIYKNNPEIYSVPPSEALAMLNRAKQFFVKSTQGYHTDIEEAYAAFDISRSIYDFKGKISEVNIILFTNGTVRATPLPDEEIGKTVFSFAIWDIEKLFREISSGVEREKIEIDLRELTNKTLKCVKVDVPATTHIEDDGLSYPSGGYTSYFTVFPGELLFSIYEKYNSRLLEKNVRAYLQARGNKSVNGGIKLTIQKKPEMFLAYNNGISATAESVILEDETVDSAVIVGLNNFQIVNGGQTTASIFNACNKNKEALKDIYVQAKITVVNDQSQMEKVVPMISKCANTQNKIQIADFSANDKYHVKIEEFSRTVWAPAKTGGEQQTKWFYERARGQYADTRSREKSTKYFDSVYPKKQYFDKLELARFENVWDLLPHVTSRGGQASFSDLTVRLKERKGFLPDQEYYCNLIAKAIMYRKIKSIVREQNFLGFWANIADYSMSYISYKTAQRIDLSKIWKDQAISPVLERATVTVAQMVYKYIVDSANGQNTSQWCKKEACWVGLQKLEIPLPEAIIEELIPIGRRVSTALSQNINAATGNEKDLIEHIQKISSKTWFNISGWAKETSNLESYQRSNFQKCWIIKNLGLVCCIIL